MLVEEGKRPRAPRLSPGIRWVCCYGEGDCRLKAGGKVYKFEVLTQSFLTRKSEEGVKFLKSLVFVETLVA